MIQRLFFLLSLFSSLLFAEELTPITVQLKWFHQFQFAGYYAALEKGFYKDEGFDVKLKERSNTTNSIQQVIHGEAQFGVADSSLILHRMRGEKVKILASIFQHSPLIFIARKDSNIMSPYEMLNKNVMLERGIDDSSLIALLYKTDMMNHVTLIPQTFDIQNLINKKVDVMSAYITDQPFRLKEKGVETTIINPLNYGIDFYGDNLFTTEEMIKKHPQIVQKFLRATLKGWEYAMKNPQEIIEIILAKYPTKLSRQALEYEAQEMRKFILPDLVKIGTSHPERFYHIAQIYHQLGFVDNNYHTLEDFIYDPSKDDYPLTHSFFIGLGIIAFLILFLIALLAINKKLKSIIAAKVAEVEKMNHMLEETNLHLYDKVNQQVADLRKKDLILIQQSRHATMGEMISAIAHQWRQPLNIVGLLIQDLAYLYKNNELSPQDFDEGVEKVMSQLSHMSQTINDFRNFFKPDEKHEDVSLADLVEESLSLISHQLTNNHISVIIEKHHNPILKLAKSSFKHIVINIVNNAKDQIMTTNPENRSISIMLDASLHEAIIEIRDHAGGIPLSIIDKIFDPYFSTKGEKGTGVGLYMAKMIIEEHLQGTISVTNSVDGAIFEIKLPI